MSTTNPASSGAEAPQQVVDVWLRVPKTLPPDISVAEARAALRDDHVHMLLLTTEGRLFGTLLRSDLPAAAADAAPALPFAVLAGRTVSATLPAEEARQILIRRGERRLAVVDTDGRLLGLLCLKRQRTGFCSDADVAARGG